MILTSAEMKEQEEQAFKDGCTPESLMEEAGARIALAVRKFAPAARRCDVFFGKGNNGGDALVAARHLAEAGWNINPAACFPGIRMDGAYETEIRAVSGIPFPRQSGPE